MADIGSFLSNIALGAGRNIQYSQQQEERQAQLDDLRSQTAMRMQTAKMQADQSAQAQSLMKFRQAVASSFQTDQSLEGDAVSSHQKASQMLSAQANALRRGGDFAGSKELEGEAERESRMGKEAAAEVSKADTAKKEAFADAALAVQMNPKDPTAGRKFLQSAIAVGVDPTQIPLPGTPEYANFLKTAAMSNMTARQQMGAAEKIRKADEDREEKKREFDQRSADRNAARAQTAAIQAGNLDVKRMLAQSLISSRDAKAAGGAPMSVSERKDVAAIVGSGAEAMRGLRIIGKMPPGQTAGAFSGLHTPGGITEALSHVGANTVTPQSMQMYNTAAEGLGLELGRVLTLGGGRGVNQSQINAFQEMTKVKPGDTEFEAMFKFANAADIVRNRFQTLADHPNPKIAAQQREVEDLLKRIPTPEDVIAAAPSDKKAAKGGMLKNFSTMSAAANALMGAADTPKPPSSGGLSESQQSAISKYLSK